MREGVAAALCFAALAASPRAFADYPLASHRYLADPGVLIRDGRIYLYASNDGASLPVNDGEIVVFAIDRAAAETDPDLRRGA
jgi:arabinoxylan arabinofuranohydrolase